MAVGGWGESAKERGRRREREREREREKGQAGHDN